MFTDVQDALRQVLTEDSNLKLASTSKLARALEQFPYAAELHFIYGSELAEAGNLDDAAKSLGQALVLQPDMHLARFQLAFLYLVNGSFDAVQVLLKPLIDDFGNKNYLTIFAKGCIAATQGNIDDCKQLIEQGLALNGENEALNANMKKLSDLLLTDGQNPKVDKLSEDNFDSVLFDIYKQQKH